MPVNANEKVPLPTLERLANYLRYLADLQQDNIRTISSAKVEEQTGINASQFRKDLSYFGEFGHSGIGYIVSELHDKISEILRVNQVQNVIIVGAGNLGSALIGYPGLTEHKFNVVAVFDNNKKKIGRLINGVEISDSSLICKSNASLKADLAIIAVPRSEAQRVAETLIEAGIAAILNFAPTILRTPKHVSIRNVSFLQEMAVLSYQLSLKHPSSMSRLRTKEKS